MFLPPVELTYRLVYTATDFKKRLFLRGIYLA